MGGACSSAPKPTPQQQEEEEISAPPLPPPPIETPVAAASKPFAFKDFSENDDDDDNNKASLRYPSNIDSFYEIGHIPSRKNNLLGIGRFACVCLGIEKLTQTRVAVKVIDKPYAEHKSRDVYLEVLLLQRALPHPNIIPLLDVFEHTKKLFVILKYAEQGDLFDVIHQQGRFSDARAKQTLGMLCSALQHLHSLQILHRDVKPENVFVGEDNVVYLGDFGLAEDLTDETVDIQQRRRTAGGSLPYSAPEVRTLKYGLPSDMWGLGCVAYVVLTGEHPFRRVNTARSQQEDNEQEQEEELSAMLQRIDACEYTMEKHECFTAFPLAKDFVSRLLVLAPEERMSANQAINHDWLNSRFAALNDDDGESEVHMSALNTPSEPSSEE